MLLPASLHAVAGLTTFASILAIVGVPTVLAVLLLSFLLLFAFLLLLTFLLLLACFPDVGRHAVTLAVACCWRHCYCVRHCCCERHCCCLHLWCCWHCCYQYSWLVPDFLTVSVLVSLLWMVSLVLLALILLLLSPLLLASMLLLAFLLLLASLLSLASVLILASLFDLVSFHTVLYSETHYTIGLSDHGYLIVFFSAIGISSIRLVNSRNYRTVGYWLPSSDRQRKVSWLCRSFDEVGGPGGGGCWDGSTSVDETGKRCTLFTLYVSLLKLATSLQFSQFFYLAGGNRNWVGMRQSPGIETSSFKEG